MVWVAVAVISVGLIGLVIALGSRAMNIPREPDREAPQDKEAAQAYARVSHWPIFILERHTILSALESRKPRGLLVDIGCGPGYLAAGISRSYPSVRVVALDINNEMINIAKRDWPPGPYGAEFITGDAQQLPFADSTVDFVVSSLSLHHWADAVMVFGEIRRVLKPGGQFLIFDLRRDGSRLFYYALKLGQALMAPAAIRRTNGAVGSFWASYTPSELKMILSRIDIDMIRVESQFGWMLAWGRRAEA